VTDRHDAQFFHCAYAVLASDCAGPCSFSSVEELRPFHFHKDCKNATKSAFCCGVRLRLKRWL
jgi:hypothetical protein